jgi:hypothetical protein
MEYDLVKIVKSTKSGKKMMAVFKNKKTGRTKTIHFGATGYEDYTTHKDDERKNRYIERHKDKENWGDPMTAGTLSRYILWNKTSLSESIADYKRKFNL